MPFLGAVFSVQSATPIGLASLRVRFTQDPKVAPGSGSALSPTAYTLTGPDLNFVTSVSVVTGDLQAVDLFLAYPLELGTWTLDVAGLVSNEAVALVDPFAVEFAVTKLQEDEAVSGGAENDDVVAVLRKHFNPALRGPNWDSILAAIADGDAKNWENSRLAFDQLFIGSASGKYLARRGADQGIRKPPGVAMSDELYRDLVVVSKTSKLTQDAVLEVLEIFYGADAVRASMTSGPGQPFELEHGDDLILDLDERNEFVITFRREEFARIGEATAVEVAASISRQLHSAGSQGYAVAYAAAAGDRVRIYSGRLGISSSVRIVGGKAQTTLMFSSEHPDSDDFIFEDLGSYGAWGITKSTETAGNMRFTRSGASLTFTDFNLIQEGDYVLIFGTEFNAANQGTWQVKSVGYTLPGPVQWFEVENDAGVVEAVTQNSYRSLQFHRSRKKTIYSEPRHTLVSQTGAGIEVTIPATTQAVSRKPYTGAYGVQNEATELATVGSVRKRGVTEFECSSAHGLVTGDMVLVENAATDADSITAGDLDVVGTPSISTTPIAAGIADASQRTVIHQAGTFDLGFHKGVRLGDVALFFGGARYTNPAGVATIGFPAPLVKVLRVTSITQTAGGSRRVNYAWEELGIDPTAGEINFGLAVIGDIVVMTGGMGAFTINPSGAFDVIRYRDNPRVAEITSGTMPFEVAAHASTYFDGKVLVCGGARFWNLAKKDTWQYNLSLQTWTQVADMKFPRIEHEAVATAAGVLVIGGHDPAHQDVETNDVNYWKLDDDGIDSIGGLNLTLSAGAVIDTPGKVGTSLRVGVGHSARASAGAAQTTLNDRLRNGGFSIECWLVDQECVIFENQLNAGIGGATGDYTLLRVARVANGVIQVSWVAADGTLNVCSTTKSIYDVSIGLNQTGIGTNWPPFYHLVITVYAEGAVRELTFYVNGKIVDTVIETVPPAFGANGRFSILHQNQVDEVKIVSAVLTEAEVLARYRKNRGVTLREFPNQNLEANNEYPTGPLHSTCEFWNGSTWTQVGSLRQAKVEFAAVKLPGDKVLVLGGLGYDPGAAYADPVPLKTVDIWDPETRFWRPLPDMTYARRGHTATYLVESNEVWVYGGQSATLVEVLDLDTMTWRTIGVAAGAFPKTVRAVALPIGTDAQGIIGVAGGIKAVAPPLQVTNTSNYIIVPGEDIQWTGGMNGVFKATRLSATKFSIAHPGYSAHNEDFLSESGDVAKVTAFKAQTTEALGFAPGPFTFDLENGISVTGIEAPTASVLKAGHQYISLTFASSISDPDPALRFPDEPGWLVFDFGRSKQVWPVPYVGRISDTALALDASVVFPIDLPAGTTVHYASQRAPLAPSTKVAGLYLTTSETGKKAAVEALEDTIGAGVPSDVRIVYPGDRGLGGEGFPARGNYKLSDVVRVWGGDNTSLAVKTAQEDEDL